uniref:Brain acid soluble protein 1 n=1 Tax=Haplochromis burtoni TaxID=8153 RepID=A0A3Q2WAX6_HAPBU
MGGKLSKKRKGYDVSDPKEKKDESTATVASADNSAKGEGGAPPTGEETTAEAGNVEDEKAVTAEAAVPQESEAPENSEKEPAAQSDSPALLFSWCED